NSGSDEPVYTVPSRSSLPSPRPSKASEPQPPEPGDQFALARALQRELKRVGCYGGEVTGVGSPSSRMAMKTCRERVNAALPVEKPDPVLLSLVQGHRERACRDACPTGQAATDGGTCAPGGALKPEVGADAGRSEAPKAGVAASSGAA